MTKKPWVDPDDDPPATAEVLARAEVSEGGVVTRAATGTLTRDLRAEADAGRERLAEIARLTTLPFDPPGRSEALDLLADVYAIASRGTA